MLDPALIKDASARLAPVAFHTPMAASPHLGKLVGARIFLKLENLQRTGSFKIRGAYYRLAKLADQKRGHGVAAASAGNHAQGVALSAHLLGLKAIIFMPVCVSLSKRQATLSHHADVRLVGQTIEHGLEAARALGSNYTLIHPYDDYDIMAGQGTIALEILADMPDLDAVVIPLGGGGLIAGMATAIKALAPKVKVVGVEPAAAASGRAAVSAGGPVPIVTLPTMAEGARVAQVGERCFPAIRDLVDDLVPVEEELISQAMLLLMERRRIVAEGAGALGLAAMLSGRLHYLKGKKVVLLVSGGNVDSNLLGRVINQGLARSGRIFRFSAVINDLPGALAYLLRLVAAAEANVLHLTHDRLSRDLPPDKSRVTLEVETRGFDHSAEIAERLAESGFQIREE